MKDFIDDYITTLSARRANRIYSLLEESQLFKKDVEGLVNKLNDIRKNAPVVIKSEVPGLPVLASKLESGFRDVHINISDMYRVSNMISSILYNNSVMLTSEIKAIEDELVAMEKTINDYAFGLADGGFYDYVFTETFSDEIMKETFDFSVEDRDGTAFESNEQAVVNSASGILTLSPYLTKSYSLTGLVNNSNCLSYATSNTGLQNALNENVTSGWRVAISSPRPISSNITGATGGGAQVAIELFLQNPSPCDTLIVTPFSDLNSTIVSLKIYKNLTDNNHFEILTEPTSIDKPTNFSFPMQAVAKVSMIVSQPIYKRRSQVVDRHEAQFRVLNETIKKERDDFKFIKGKEYARNKKVQKYIFLRAENARTKYPEFFRSQTPNIDFDVATGPLTLDKMLFKRNSPEGQDNIWKQKSKTQSIMRRMISQRLFAGSLDVRPRRTLISRGSDFSGGFVPALNKEGEGYKYHDISDVGATEADFDPYALSSGSDSILNYEYDFGLRNVKIGSGISIYNGVYISKTLPAPSDSGEVRIKVQDTNYQLRNTVRDDPVVTSIEYSVTNKSTPKKESDWMPILPSGFTTVESERFFVDDSGFGKFRFPAALTDNISIYKNGVRLQFATESAYTYSANKQSIVGLRLPADLILSSDILTCSYTPAADATVINFEKQGFSQSILASAYDENGAGESFTGTTQDRLVSLSYDPYVDYDQVEQYGSYGVNGFTGTYQPIVIQMADGTIAKNQTNYSGFLQNSLEDYADSTTVHYIHSGKNIIFNKVITERFTVFYQYLPSNLRFKIVLRVNDIAFVTPNVDSIQVKSKTRKADSRKVF